MALTSSVAPTPKLEVDAVLAGVVPEEPARACSREVSSFDALVVESVALRPSLEVDTLLPGVVLEELARACSREAR